jgi:hypothetical protein
MSVLRRDYDTTVQDLIEQIQLPSSPIYYSKWTKFDENDIGEAIISLLGAYSHTIDYYLQYYIKNMYLPTEEIKAREQIYELLNYKPGIKRSAVITVNLMWDECGATSVISIPKYTQFKVTADSVDYTFLSMADSIYIENTSRLYVDLMLGELNYKTYVVTDIIGSKILVSTGNVDTDSVSFTVDGLDWEKVRNIYYELNPSRQFSVHIEEDGTYIYLPSTWRNLIPSDSISEIIVRAANLKEGFDIQTAECVIIEFIDDIKDGDGNSVKDKFKILLIDNTSSPTDFSITMDRIITLEDYEKMAKSYSGIAMAKAYNWEEGANIGVIEPNKVKLVVCGFEGIISTFVKRGLKAFLDSIALKELELEILDPIYRKINIFFMVNIGTYKGSVQQAEIYQGIRNEIDDYFSIENGNVQIGKAVDIDELIFRVSRSSSKIRFVDVVNYMDYEADPRELPILGKIGITFDSMTLPNFDIFYADDNAEAGPLGIDSISMDYDNVIELMAYINVREEIDWVEEDPETYDAEFTVSDSITCDDSVNDFININYINVLSYVESIYASAESTFV